MTHPAREAGVSVRRFATGDAARVVEICRESPGAAQWPQRTFEKLAESGESGWVAETGGVICGFIVTRRVAQELEILNLAVGRSYRQQGKASKLLNAALADPSASPVERVFLEVRESNNTAAAFYTSHGFEQTGNRRGYYQDPPENAVVMERKITG